MKWIVDVECSIKGLLLPLPLSTRDTTPLFKKLFHLNNLTILGNK